MGGVVRLYSNVFGYEQENGSVHSVIASDIYKDIFFDFVNSRTLPPNHTSHKIYHSVLDFFSDENFFTDDSKWRVLYKLDNTSEIRCYRKKSKYIFSG